MPSRTFTFDFVGLHGRPARCGLEIISLSDGRSVVIATELSDNPGVSVTNFAEELASIVCRRFAIDPEELVWIEHYPADPCPRCSGTGRRGSGRTCLACHGRGTRREAATFDLVSFDVRSAGTGPRLVGPQWRPMREEDWRAFGLEPRQ